MPTLMFQPSGIFSKLTALFQTYLTCKGCTDELMSNLTFPLASLVLFSPVTVTTHNLQYTAGIFILKVRKKKLLIYLFGGLLWHLYLLLVTLGILQSTTQPSRLQMVQLSLSIPGSWEPIRTFPMPAQTPPTPRIAQSAQEEYPTYTENYTQ